KIKEWDFRVFLRLYQSEFSKNEKIKKFANIYSFFGNYYFWGLIWIIMGIHAYFFTKDYYLLVLFTGAFDQGFIIYILVRYKITNRNRPFITLEKEGVKRHDDFILESKSFPSGHVTFFLYFGFIFAFYFIDYFWLILIIFIVLDVIMAITRLILGVHYPTDVIFGFIFACLFALLYLGLTYVYWVNFYYWLGDIWTIIKIFFINLFS
ncbi:MAG: phosphatase PAP2 family protein, partial [Promethearchaeota archaeon]